MAIESMAIDRPRSTIVSFDCASTLLATDYSPEGFALRAAALAGLDPTPDAESVYRSLYHARFAEYTRLNTAGDASEIQRFWVVLTREWAARCGMPDQEERLLEAAEKLLYSLEHRYFSLYDDVIPCLETLRAEGYRMIVLSNWDYTLHRVLEAADLARFFERTFASLEFGCEKPDPRFFRFAESELGLSAEAFVHVGDREDDDLEGAAAAGWRALLIERGRGETVLPRLNSLADLPEALRSATF